MGVQGTEMKKILLVCLELRLGGERSQICKSVYMWQTVKES